MNILDLFITVGLKGVEETMNGITGLASGIGGTLAKAGKATVAAAGAATLGAVTAAGAAGAALTKSALDGYASYEQLAGGVEKLYGDSADTLLEYAENAYRTAGMSANEYMSTATEFSASLISSLGGDTEEAARLTDVAMQAMSDNISVFGSDAESVRNAIKGFSRGNYTMLDNLKLGFSGSKEEAERLVREASTMTEEMERLGVTVDADSLSMDNMVSAIAVMQAHMGIAGTTAAEAGQTIEGSVTMMKTAWENLVTAFARGDAENAINNFVASFDTAATNIVPKVIEIVGTLAEQLPMLITQLGETVLTLMTEYGPQLIENIGALIQGVMEVIPPLLEQAVPLIADLLVKLIQVIVEAIPTFIEIVGQLLVAVLEAISSDEMIQSFNDAVTGIINAIVELLPTLIPALLTAGVNLFKALVDAVSENLDDVINGVMDVIDAVIEVLPELIPTLLQAAIDLFVAIVQALPIILPRLVTAAGELIGAVVSMLPTLIPMLFSAAKELFMAIVNVVPTLVGDLVGAVGNLIGEAISSIGNFGRDIWNKGKELIGGLKQGVEDGFHAVGDFFVNLPGNVVNILGNVGSTLWNAGSGIIDGLRRGAEAAWEGTKNFFGGLLNTIASIKGPLDKDRKALIPAGKAIMAGLSAGLDTGWGKVEDQIGGYTNDLFGGFSSELDVSAKPSAVGGISMSFTGCSFNVRDDEDIERIGDAIAARASWQNMGRLAMA